MQTQSSHSDAIRTQCLMCKQGDLKEIVHLGMHPFADTFTSKDLLVKPETVYPLVCDLCTNCGNIQLRHKTNPLERYCGVEYSYTSSNSAFSRSHWSAYAEQALARTLIPSNGFVVEIGSNDGFLLEQFMHKGHRVLGVDPSPVMGELAQKRQVTTLPNLFDMKTAQEIVARHGYAHIIAANNVFNHADDPLDFTRAAALLLDPQGTFIFEVPYWATDIISDKFDKVYHEHVLYFTVKSAAFLMEQAGLRISSCEIVNYHGESIRIYAKKETALSKHAPEVLSFIDHEEKNHLFEPERYQQFMKNCFEKRARFTKKLLDIKLKGGTIIAIGAATKGNTFLNFYRLDRSIIDYVTDSSPFKIGKYTPLSRIPICDDSVFKNYEGKEVYALVLAWNIVDFLKKILAPINPNIHFISPEEE